MTQKIKQHLRNLYAFFIKNDQGFQSSLKFSFWTFAFEMLWTCYALYLISTKVRFRGVFSYENSIVLLITIYFFARVFLTHISLGFILRVLEEVFAVRWKKTFYALTVIYAYLFIATKYPQNFDEFGTISIALKNIRLFDYTWILYVPALAALSLLVVSFVKFQKRTPLKVGLGLLLIAAISFFVFESQQLYPALQAPTPVSVTPKNSKKPNIIFVTVDSLRGDVPLEELPDVGPDLKNYLSQSIRFKKVISPLAQTHGAMASLFTAKNPPVTGVRTNLSHKAIDTDQLLDGSLMEQIKKAGYKLRFIHDAEEYSKFRPGKVLDQVKAPSFTVANVVISTFFKNRLVFGLFNNSLGYLFLPEIKNNTSFFYSFDLPKFTAEVMTELNEARQEEDPFFLFIHTCALHWPAVLPYPYYPQDSFPKHTETPFAYTGKFRLPNVYKMSAKAWNEQSVFNAKIYNSAVQMTVKDFLNPVFNHIRQLGLDQDSIIVLLSDHGEDYWDPKARLPYVKFVQHGSSLIFGAKSEESFLRIAVPGEKTVYADETVGVVDILPTVMDYAQIPAEKFEGHSLRSDLHNEKNEDRIYYSETGLWPFKVFRDQFIATPPNSLGPLFRFNTDKQALYVDPQFLPGIVQQKQRAAYYKDYRLTMYPTNYGYREFLCDRQADPNCEKNVMSEHPALAKKLHDYLRSYVDLDIKNGLLKPGACSPFLKGSPSAELKNIKEYQWQYYYQALECLRSNNDYAYASEILDHLWADAEVAVQLKSQIEKTFIDLCKDAAAFKAPNLPRYLKQTLTPALLEAEVVPHLNKIRDCLRVLGETDLAKKLEAKFGIEKLKNLTDDGEAEPESGTGMEFRALLRRYSETNAPSEKRDLYQKMSDHPMADFFVHDLAIAKIYENAKGDTSVIQRGLDQYFSAEINYNLADYLERYYFVTTRNMLAKDPEQGLFRILQQIVSDKPLPISYFNFVLYRIDQVTGPDDLPKVSGIRFEYWQESPLKKGVRNLRQIENSVAALKVKKYLCGRKSPYCNQVRALVESSQAQEVYQQSYLKSRQSGLSR